MGSRFPLRQHARISTHLHGTLESGSCTYSITVSSLSEAGFYGDGFDLDSVGATVGVKLNLEISPEWSPEKVPAEWNGPKARLQEIVCQADVLYLDLGRQAAGAERKVGVGARFEGLSSVSLSLLREFISRQVFRESEWRTAGGAIPMPMAGSVSRRGMSDPS
jgi:hypothetical protein